MRQQTAAARSALERAGELPHSVTIGNFDGVHRGHQYLLQQVVDDARERGTRSLVVTFEPHPTAVLRPDVPFERLATAERKLQLIRQSGIDDMAIVPFDRAFSQLSPEEFLDIVFDTASPAAIHVGEGFRFGHNRAGDGDTIIAYGREHGFEARVVARLRDAQHVISSSSIREALTHGDIEQANAWLGRRYRLSGTVEHGAARGRALGYPTANLFVAPGICIPADGIYAAYAHVPSLRQSARQAMVYIGSRPTFDNGQRLVEVNILDFSGDLYTLDLEVEFVGFIRADQAFQTAAALSHQMQRDEEATRRVLEKHAPEVRAGW